ncbi:MAG TPA: NINE protein [Candidatus Obscuribacterales bacterium]
MASSASSQRLTLSYILWLAGFFGVPGLHRLYNGKILTGLLWFFTLGLLGVGQFIDLFFVSRMAEDYELKRLKAHYHGDLSDLLKPPAAVTQTVRPPTRNEKMVSLLKAAQGQGGQISVTQAVLETGMEFEEVEELLRSMLKSGYAAIDNHPTTGVIIYRFDELMA